MNARRHATRRRQPTLSSFEGLEPRACMAGDVDAVVNGGVLQITGDDLGNDIEVRQLTNLVLPFGTSQLFQVTGRNGTTVNGKPADILTFNGNDLRINLKGGDDRLDIKGTDLRMKLNRLTIETGSGDDQVDIDDLEVLGTGTTTIRLGGGGTDVDFLEVDASRFVGDVKITTGDGDDTVEFGAGTDTDVLGRLTVETGDGNDDVVIGGDFDPIDIVGNLVVKTGDGDDTVELEEVTAPKITVDLGDGKSQVSAREMKVAGRFAVKGGDAVNTITFAEVDADELAVDSRDARLNASFTQIKARVFGLKSGDRQDTISMSAVAAADVFASLGRGNDAIDMNLVVANRLRVKGESGSDTIRLTNAVLTAGNGFGGTLKVEAGDDDDRVDLHNVQAVSALLDGGDDTDTLVQDTVTFPNKEVKRFEIVQ